MGMVLLPASSQLVAKGEHGLLLALYERSSRLFYLLNASMTGAVVVFASPLLTHWVGPEYGQIGGLAFALLAIASGLNAASMTASRVNAAMGRPKINLAFSLANSFLNLATVYFFTVRYGIAGTAASGLLAAGVVTVFLHYSHRRVLATSTWNVFRTCYARTTVTVGLVSAVAWMVLRPLASDLPITLGLVAVTATAGLLASAASGSFTSADWTTLRSALRSGRAETPDTVAESDGHDVDE
jgi:O-antigen/teichoic acid export membrane protein